MLVACLLIPHLPLQVETARRPDLRRQPFVIYDEGSPLSRIVDATPGMGVHAGMPLNTALQRCADAIPLVADFRLYARRWAAIVARLKRIGGDAEDAGLGCAYVAVNQGADRHDTDRFGSDDARFTAALMRAVPTDWNACVGVGPGKFPARCAAATARPNHAVRLPDDESARRACLAPVSVNSLPIDVRRLAALHDLGIHTLGHVAAVSPSKLESAVGDAWALVWQLAHGIDHRPVAADDSVYAPEPSQLATVA